MEVPIRLSASAGIVGFPPERLDLKDKGHVSERGQLDTTRNMSLVYSEVLRYVLGLFLDPSAEISVSREAVRLTCAP